MKNILTSFPYMEMYYLIHHMIFYNIFPYILVFVRVAADMELINIYIHTFRIIFSILNLEFKQHSLKFWIHWTKTDFLLFWKRSDDTEVEHSYFGRKYIGVGTGGTLEIHGRKKLSWTFLNKTLHPGQGNENSYRFERSWGNRGIIIHVINPKTGEVLHTDRSVGLDLSSTCIALKVHS